MSKSDSAWSGSYSREANGCTRLKNFPHLGRASSRMTGRRELMFPPLLGER
jgi:hypothetical protein